MKRDVQYILRDVPGADCHNLGLLNINSCAGSSFILVYCGFDSEYVLGGKNEKCDVICVVENSCLGGSSAYANSCQRVDNGS